MHSTIQDSILWGIIFETTPAQWVRIRGLWKLSDGRDWGRSKKLGLVLVGGAMLCKALIQFSVNGQGCVSSLLLALKPNYDGGNEDNGDLLQKVPCSYPTIALISHTSKVMLKILQVRLQQYVNWEFPEVQAGFIKSRGTRDQIVNIHWIIKKAREFQKNVYFCCIDYAKAFDCGSQKTVKFLKRWE